MANGADAVYFGIDQFNARQRATNFTADELREVVAYLHNHNVRAYLVLNVLIFPDELDRVAALVSKIASAGPDAVIVHDIGVLCLLKRMAPDLPVHASTQMTLTTAAAVDLVGRAGIERAILAREGDGRMRGWACV